eukprot:2027328-Prymnesium_polylepis.1
MIDYRKQIDKTGHIAKLDRLGTGGASTFACNGSYGCYTNTAYHDTARPRPGMSTTPTPQQRDAPPPAAEPPARVTGVLVKQGAKVKSWKSRFFVFEDGDRRRRATRTPRPKPAPLLSLPCSLTAGGALWRSATRNRAPPAAPPPPTTREPKSRAPPDPPPPLAKRDPKTLHHQPAPPPSPLPSAGP